MHRGSLPPEASHASRIHVDYLMSRLWIRVDKSMSATQQSAGVESTWELTGSCASDQDSPWFASLRAPSTHANVDL